MTGIPEYSTTAGTNASLGGVNVAEGMVPAAVNDALRQMMADLRTALSDLGWFNTGTGTGAGTSTANAYTWVSATSFKVLGSDVTATYRVGRRIRAVGASTGTIYGAITASSFSTDTTVTVQWDSGSLVSETLAISLASVDGPGRPLAAPLGRVPGSALTASTYTATAADAGRLVLCDTSSNNITLTLPAAAAITDRAMRLRFRKSAGSSNAVTLTRAGSDTIVWSTGTGITSAKLCSIGDYLELESDGSATWHVVGEQVRVEARVDRNGSGQLINASTVTKFQFNHAAVDTHGAFDTATNFRYTATVAGVYLVSMQLCSASIGDQVAMRAMVQKNGTTVFQSTGDVSGASNQCATGCGGLIEMNGSSDYIEGSALHTDSGANTFSGDASLSFLHIVRVSG